MAEYGMCVFCGGIVTIPYGATQAQCANCGAIYGITETSQATSQPQVSQGFFGPLGHSGEGWWLLGGIIIGVIIGWPASQAVLRSAIGLGTAEIERRTREVAARIEARKR